MLGTTSIRPKCLRFSAQDATMASLLERFQAAPIKIAIQKDGALSEIACGIIRDTYSVAFSPMPISKIPVGVSEDGRVGVVYARNKSICSLVLSGAVTVGVVGIDRLIEEKVQDKVEKIASFASKGSWSLVLATPMRNAISGLEQIRRIATQYPVIAKEYFAGMGRKDIDIVPTQGGTELYPYLDYGNKRIDGVIDLVATGTTLQAHNMVVWSPSIKTIYPVLIQARSAYYGSRIQ